MKTKEAIKQWQANMLDELNRYTPQRDADGNRFIYSPFPDKEDFTNINREFEDIELDDYEDLDPDEVEAWENEAREEVHCTYDRIAVIRKEFEDKHCKEC